MYQKIMLDGVEYVRADTVPAPVTGARAVVVVDRGWIFAGDVERRDGRIYIRRAVWLFRWESIGLDGVMANPKSDKATIKKIPDVDLPDGAEICCFPVADEWGL